MGVSGRLPSFSGPHAFVCVRLAGPAVEAFWLRDVSWNHASSPGTNPPGVEALEAVKKDGARGGGGGLARTACSRGWRSDWPFSGAVVNHRTASPVNRRFWCWVLSDGITTTTIARVPSRLNAPSGAGCFLAPTSGNGVVAPLPGAGAPPAPQAPRGTGQHRPYLTTFRRPDAKRHRRHLRHLQLPVSDGIKPKGQRSRL